MSIRKYKFVSPSIQIREVDNSQRPRVSDLVGPVVVGRSRMGPGLRPVKVESFSEFIEIFGEPVAGGLGGDPWRDGNLTAPTYGAYAAQAWLRNNGPLTYVRLLGAQHDDTTTAGKAGWETKDSTGASNVIGINDAAGGAYGLFVIDSGSQDNPTGSNPTPMTGALAAVWYLSEGSIVLTGTLRGSTNTLSGTAVLIKSAGTYKEFKAIVRDASSNVVETTSFNFNPNSKKYIRKVFNTSPTLTNGSVTSTTKNYWLGSTYERHLDTLVTSSTQYGVILGLGGSTAAKGGSTYRFGAQAPQTGWFFAQDTQVVGGVANSYQPENMTKLFKFVGIDNGTWTQNNLKVSIQDIKPSTNPADPYGLFTVVIRKSEDSDNAVRIVERFSSCNLNPFSPNYVAKKVGDRYVTWDDDERRYREYGNHANNSKFLRIEMNTDVDTGATSADLVPFGVFGPPRHKGFTLMVADIPMDLGTSTSASANEFSDAFVRGENNIVRSPNAVGTFVHTGIGATQFTGSFLFPTLQQRSSSAGGLLASPKQAYFGMDNSLNTSTVRFDSGYGEYLLPMPAGYGSFATATDIEYSWIFTLDDLEQVGSNGIYVSGSRAAGDSVTAQSADNYRAVLDAGFDRFTAPLHGGFDGLDINEKEPFNNTDLEGGSDTTNYAFNSVKRAIDAVSDPEVLEINAATIPGVTNEPLTDHLLKVCEDRADALAIIDPKGGYLPPSENTLGDDSATNRGSVATTITNLRDRGLNSSYGCAYYPWVQIRDDINGQTLWAPPSIVALGTMASSEINSELWFAPAGFTRGGLSEGSAGIPVVGIRQRLTSRERDDLYEANINPIATFPAEGIVIFGQKTLQVTPSALDRINVRRLLIFLKKEISRMAATILFDQNVKVTWNRFLGKVEPFLRSVQVRLGLEDFKVVLDETTTTPELIDRNIMYAKIFLKPAKAIEYIAIDFNISDSGASFAD